MMRRRVCSKCQSETTTRAEKYKRKQDGKIALVPHWYKDDKDGYLCYACYAKYVRVWDKNIQLRRFRFKDKKIMATQPVRKGICNICGADTMRTNLHHLEYDTNSPLAHTVEICVVCHAKQHPQIRDPITGRFIKLGVDGS